METQHNAQPGTMYLDMVSRMAQATAVGVLCDRLLARLPAAHGNADWKEVAGVSPVAAKRLLQNSGEEGKQ